MTPAPVTAALVAEAGSLAFTGVVGEGAAPTFLVGWLSPMSEAAQAGAESGSVVFVRAADGGWSAFLPRPGEAVIGVYAAPSSGATIVASMWQTEGPGQSWTLLRSADGLASGTCVTVNFPDELNNPAWANEYLDLTDLDIAADGGGEIIGVARTESRGDLWFAYETTDGGASWGAPSLLPGARDAKPGEFAHVADAAAPDLAEELTRFAAGR